MIFSKICKKKEKDKEKLKKRWAHVEIFLGGETGEKTIGARKKKGVVSYWDTYKIDNKKYEGATYHFRSLNSLIYGTTPK